MKKATINLKEMPGKVISSPAKKEKKRAGLAWLWSKIKAPFVGATGGDGAAGGLASASRAGGVLEEIGSSAAEEAGGLARGAGELAEEAGGLGQQFDELAARVAARLGAEASPWVGKAIMAAITAGVVATGVLAAHHLMSASGSLKTPYGGPIASGINAHPSGPNAIGNTPTGYVASRANTVAGNNTATPQSAKTPTSGKTAVPNVPTPSGGKTPNLGSLAMPSNASFGGGAPIGGAGAAPQYMGQAAQEAAMQKIAWKPQATVTAMTSQNANINRGSMGFRGGRAFRNGQSLAALRSAVGYNAAMNGYSNGNSGAAQNAINQFDNQMTSGGGISAGGITTGSADSANSVGGQTPSMMGGGGGGSGYGTSSAGDIGQVCTADQLSKGWISNGSACVQPPGAGGGNNASPWQWALNLANMLLGIAGSLVIVAGILVATGYADPVFQGWQIPIGDILAGIAIGMGVAAAYLATRIGSAGGHQQALMVGLESISVIAGGVMAFFGGTGWGLFNLATIALGAMAVLGPLLGG